MENTTTCKFNSISLRTNIPCEDISNSVYVNDYIKSLARYYAPETNHIMENP